MMSNQKDGQNDPTWDGELAGWPDYVRSVRLQYETTSRKKRRLLGPRLALRLTGKAREEVNMRCFAGPTAQSTCYCFYVRSWGKPHSRRCSTVRRSVHQIEKNTWHTFHNLGIPGPTDLQTCTESFGACSTGPGTRSCFNQELEVVTSWRFNPGFKKTDGK